MKTVLKYIFVITAVVFLSTPNKIYAQNVDKLYEKIDLFSEVLEKIQNEYVDEIPLAMIMKSAIELLFFKFIDLISAALLSLSIFSISFFN